MKVHGLENRGGNLASIKFDSFTLPSLVSNVEENSAIQGIPAKPHFFRAFLYFCFNSGTFSRKTSPETLAEAEYNYLSRGQSSRRWGGGFF